VKSLTSELGLSGEVKIERPQSIPKKCRQKLTTLLQGGQGEVERFVVQFVEEIKFQAALKNFENLEFLGKIADHRNWHL
jgi:hypothetical protein